MPYSILDPNPSAEDAQLPPGESVFAVVIAFIATLALCSTLVATTSSDPTLSYIGAAILAVWLEALVIVGLRLQGRRPRWFGVIGTAVFVAVVADVWEGPDSYGRLWTPDILLIIVLVAMAVGSKRFGIPRSGDRGRSAAELP